VEYWNDGVLGFPKDIILFKLYRLTFADIIYNKNLPARIFPIFQYFSIPTAVKLHPGQAVEYEIVGFSYVEIIAIFGSY